MGAVVNDADCDCGATMLGLAVAVVYGVILGAVAIGLVWWLT